MEQDLPIRCRAEEVTGQLRLVLAGMPFLAEHPWKEVGWGRMRIELLSLWKIELLLEPVGGPDPEIELQLSLVDRAAAPDGRSWVYGCQRDDWTLGPESRVVEPLQFLSGQERQALTEVLQQAVCWPEPLAANPATAWAMAPTWVFHEEIGRRRPPQRPRRKPKGRAVP